MFDNFNTNYNTGMMAHEASTVVQAIFSEDYNYADIEGITYRPNAKTARV